LGDWLGTGTVGGKRDYRPFKEARKFAHGLKLKGGMADWIVCKKPADIPGRPDLYYTEWAGWFDFLGSGRRPKGKWLPFQKARKFARSLNLTSKDQWMEFSRTNRRPNDIPANPSQIYASSGWIDWFDWLGAGRRIGGWRSFEKARAYVRCLKLKSRAEWRAYCKSGEKPVDIPADPRQAYKDEFVSDVDWFGCSGRVWRPFPQARKFVRALELKTQAEWVKFAKSGKRPADIPANPYGVYEEWKNTADWLGSGRYHRGGYHSFEEARQG
jgi:hypothetical protein